MPRAHVSHGVPEASQDSEIPIMPLITHDSLNTFQLGVGTCFYDKMVGDGKITGDRGIILLHLVQKCFFQNLSVELEQFFLSHRMCQRKCALVHSLLPNTFLKHVQLDPWKGIHANCSDLCQNSTVSSCSCVHCY